MLKLVGRIDGTVRLYYFVCEVSDGVCFVIPGEANSFLIVGPKGFFDMLKANGNFELYPGSNVFLNWTKEDEKTYFRQNIEQIKLIIENAKLQQIVNDDKDAAIKKQKDWEDVLEKQMQLIRLMNPELAEELEK